MNLRNLGAAILVAACGATAQAEMVQVSVNGVVDFNVIGGSMAGVPSGAPVSMNFQVDSNNFINGSFPTRGYAIDLNSFSMSVDGRPVPIVNPQPGGTGYFVLRDNDPAVDGFFISLGPDFPSPLTVTIPGLAPQHELDFSVGFSNGSQISSLNILDAFGTYDLSAIGSYYWAIGRFGNAGAEYAYQTITISPVPEPATLGVAAVGGLALLARRRSRH